ncbi:MAG: PilT/PilU family type 4a pilus ATPase [Candidatus Omnitrophica bacterium]|nr:PilT/PilU family type 4a pilus ATPase [Candidatus Omnitrophota bacterium]
MLGWEGIERRKVDRVFIRIPVVYEFADSQAKKPINVRVKVVFLETIGTNSFGAGCVFMGIDELDQKEISSLVERLDITKLLKMAIDKHASDLHLVAEQPLVMRINGELEFMEGQIIHADEIAQLVFSLMNKEQIRVFAREKEVDFGIQYDMKTRFRVNVHKQRGFVEAALRLIESKDFSFEELRIPQVVQDLARNKDGLILITGPTGSGKTTTIGAIVGLINKERKAVIITLERPIEYIHPNIKSVVKQREVGVDTNSFSAALKSSLRQDPNVIVVGEMDDLETIKTALIAAEAGYLVIGTFHAPDVIQAIDRLVSMFPIENRRQLLGQLSNCLRGVVAQLLVPSKDRKTRLLASEVLVATDAVKRIVRKDELFQLATIMQTGAGYKMQSMTDAIRKLVESGEIDTETAMFFSEEFGKYAL